MVFQHCDAEIRCEREIYNWTSYPTNWWDPLGDGAVGLGEFEGGVGVRMWYMDAKD